MRLKMLIIIIHEPNAASHIIKKKMYDYAWNCFVIWQWFWSNNDSDNYLQRTEEIGVIE